MTVFKWLSELCSVGQMLEMHMSYNLAPATLGLSMSGQQATPDDQRL